MQTEYAECNAPDGANRGPVIIKTKSLSIAKAAARVRPLLLSRVASASQPVHTRHANARRTDCHCTVPTTHYRLPNTQYPHHYPPTTHPTTHTSHHYPPHYPPHYRRTTKPIPAASTTPNVPTGSKKGGRSSIARIYCTRNTDLSPEFRLPRSESMYSRKCNPRARASANVTPGFDIRIITQRVTAHASIDSQDVIDPGQLFLRFYAFAMAAAVGDDRADHLVR